MRVAVVGAGPRALHAAEALLRRVRTGVSIEVFDPRPPGEGAAYATDQPPWLRLNVTSSIVDGFDAWRLAQGETPPLDPFPPRALLGRYLAHRWAELAHRHPGAVRHVRRQVTQVEPAASGWVVDGEEYDEVLLATGHAADSPDALRHGWIAPQPLVASVYPVAGLDAVPARSTVAIRGAALTFLDAALALTEGRGGRFTGPATNPAYRPGGDEPASIRPTARRGRFMGVKPQPGSQIAGLAPRRSREAALQALLIAPDAEAALAVVGSTARCYLTELGRHPVAVDAVLAGEPTHDDPVDALRASLAVATDRAVPDAGWAVGQAWRDLYPALVARFSLGGGLDFAPFGVLAERMEPLAFGPPPVNAAKLLTLVDLGLVDAGALASDTIGPAGHTGPVPVDVVVDAVLPGPGVVTGAATLPGRLVAAGLVASCPGRRGLAHDGDGTALGPDGTLLPGLAVVGRPTEDCTVGNDTLSRVLHPAVQRWATRVAARCEAAS